MFQSVKLGTRCFSFKQEGKKITKIGEGDIASKKITKYVQTCMSDEYISDETKQKEKKVISENWNSNPI